MPKEHLIGLSEMKAKIQAADAEKKRVEEERRLSESANFDTTLWNEIQQRKADRETDKIEQRTISELMVVVFKEIEVNESSIVNSAKHDVVSYPASSGALEVVLRWGNKLGPTKREDRIIRWGGFSSTSKPVLACDHKYVSANINDSGAIRVNDGEELVNGTHFLQNPSIILPFLAEALVHPLARRTVYGAGSNYRLPSNKIDPQM